jgi:hypothetical protein
LQREFNKAVQAKFTFVPGIQSKLQSKTKLEINQRDKDISEVGRNAAGSVLIQIARYSPISNQSTGLSNEGFIWSFTFRITITLLAVIPAIPTIVAKIFLRYY